ncbi:hypothetical protein AKJ65_07650 [candidate division MSBL1 archaeon SCGC-AAA259E19]|uniref:UPF0216 protein AKJ65_07650 n=1 Tax=candidate division MSBL1 archaeon SCGC-AAA259E19 TaxID=1698264 RepID=A0A133UE53_9EURY|nr:hypothetical protein AKJ65_07650 [candidate division MSBL1 archaeon SCGC-AAA259E19]
MDEKKFLKKEIRSLNRHLPKGRTSLAELLEQKKPRIETRDGSTHRFKKDELEYLAELLPEEKHSKLKLPIIIRISPQLGRGAAQVSGKIEQKVFREILDKEGRKKDNKLLIYRPEVRKIRQKLPTTTQYAFLISSRGGDPSEKVG